MTNYSTEWQLSQDMESERKSLELEILEKVIRDARSSTFLRMSTKDEADILVTAQVLWEAVIRPYEQERARRIKFLEGTGTQEQREADQGVSREGG